MFILIVNLYLPSLYFTFDPGLTVTVNFIFTLREPNFYKRLGFCLGFLATFICFCVTVLFYRYLYFVINQIKLPKLLMYQPKFPEFWVRWKAVLDSREITSLPEIKKVIYMARHFNHRRS